MLLIGESMFESLNENLEKLGEEIDADRAPVYSLGPSFVAPLLKPSLVLYRRLIVFVTVRSDLGLKLALMRRRRRGVGSGRYWDLTMLSADS